MSCENPDKGKLIKLEGLRTKRSLLTADPVGQQFADNDQRAMLSQDIQLLIDSVNTNTEYPGEFVQSI